MINNNKDSKILKFKKQKQLNIGIVTFGIIFIYLIATIIMYITAPRITSYEVRQGSILKDHSYTALALRDEIIVTASDSGYINYYAEDNSKVKVGSSIYTISTEKLNFDAIEAPQNEPLTDNEIQKLSKKVESFNDNFNQTNFSDVYSFKSDLQNSISEYTSYSKLEQLNQLLNSGNASNIYMKTSNKDGVIVLSTDGMESVTEENVKLSQLSKENYVKQEFTNNTAIMSGDQIYKLITSDYWKLIFVIDDETAELLAEKSTIKVKFQKDNQEIRAGFEIIEKEGSKLLVISMNNSMIRYSSERYLDIKLILEDQKGLKIPKTAETSKDFYIVPKDYLTLGGNNSDEGVLVQRKDSDGNTFTEFLNVNVYYEADEMVYLDPNEFGDNKTLLKPESSELYTLSQIRSLKGVYSINKGYAVFKQIKILCESDDYYIIEEGNDFGLSNYDHIALHSAGIAENDVVF